MTSEIPTDARRCADGHVRIIDEINERSDALLKI